MLVTVRRIASLSRAAIVGGLLVVCGDGPPTATEVASSDSDDLTTATGSTSTSGGEPTTAATCEDPSLPQTGPEVNVTLRNTGDVPIYVPYLSDCDRELPFRLRDASDRFLDTSLDTAGDFCDVSCAQAIAGELGCPMGCPEFEKSVKIEPGGAYGVVWPGDEYLRVTLGPECRSSAGSCAARAQAPPSLYTALAEAGDAVEGCDVCGCVVGPAGWCVTAGHLGGTRISVMATLDYPQQTTLELQFP